MVKPLRFGELAVNSNSPIFRVVKPWRVSLTYTELYRMLFDFYGNLTYLNTFLGMISDAKLLKATFSLDNRTLL